MIWERNEREQSSKYKHIKVEMQASRVITRAIRLYSKMLIIKAKLRRCRASVLIQRRTRGITGRIRAQMRRDWVNWLHFNATTIQCCFRQHLARRKVALYSKILHVKGLMAQWEAIKKEKMKELQRAGSANIIRHYYRGFKIRVKLKTIIFWNRWEKAISLQRFTRGHAGRKIYKNLLRIKLAKEKRVFDAAQAVPGILQKPGCGFYLSYEAYAFFLQAMALQNTGPGFNQSMEGANYLGYPVYPTAGIPNTVDVMVFTYPDNLVVGANSYTADISAQLIPTYQYDGSDNVRASMRFAVGVQTAVAGDGVVGFDFT